ncbi:MAG: ROK family protein [Deltaproteobacteria bacterium]|nr:ROK family protein [Deltaproteobacteria bacterium]
MPDVVGIDWGGTNFRAALVRLEENRAPEILGRFEERRPSSGSYEEDLSWAGRQLDQLAPSVRHVGVGLAAMVRRRDGLMRKAPNMGWDVPPQGIRFGSLSGTIWKRDVVVVNDMSAIAWGEYRLGAARDTDDMLCVFWGTGLGGAVIADGRLLDGAGGVAVEIGHLKVRPGGRLCGCGARGCVEAYVGGRQLLDRLRQDLSPEGPVGGSLVLQLAGGVVAAVHPGHVDEAARRGDPYALGFWDEVAEFAALAISHAVTLFDPGVVVAGGTVWMGCPDLRKRVEARVSALANAPAAQGIQFRMAQLGDDAGVLGAALLCRDRLVSS